MNLIYFCGLTIPLFKKLDSKNTFYQYEQNTHVVSSVVCYFLHRK